MLESQFQTETQTMDAAAAHVHQVNQQLQSLLTSYLSRMEPLTSQWRGGAALSFQQVKQQWHDNSTRLNEVLRSIADALVVTSRNYAGTEDVNSSGFTVLNGSM